MLRRCSKLTAEPAMCTLRRAGGADSRQRVLEQLSNLSVPTCAKINTVLLHATFCFWVHSPSPKNGTKNGTQSDGWVWQLFKYKCNLLLFCRQHTPACVPTESSPPVEFSYTGVRCVGFRTFILGISNELSWSFLPKVESFLLNLEI